ncbi:MAG: ATP-binding protein [Tissierellales bacterium]|nr:ATP-binding protein [Tissierellales bacterium]MBN2827451.1 ATP-binding protein [Tissierellales bacterium]
MKDLVEINLKMKSLVIFRNIQENFIVKKLCELLIPETDVTKQVNQYASFASALFQENPNLSELILNLILNDENIYVQKKGQQLETSLVLDECVKNELTILEEFGNITSNDIKSLINYQGYLPNWKNSSLNYFNIYDQRIRNISVYGYGIYSKHHTFTVENGNLVPVINPDKVKLNDLKGYTEERKSVIDNTLALIKGRPAANTLLYGDAGTGKSSTVKAIVNAYQDVGLRLVEVPKKQLKNISGLMDSLSHNPLKFILFIDDLSFTRNDDEFGSLKAILEGSISSRPQNVVIYATSNRRHLVKESFSEREGDDIHLNETIQELTSLSDRFGLLVSFFRPDKKQYLKIVHELALHYNIDLPLELLELEAERFAVRRSGRSPRIARQFIEYLLTLE